MAAKLTLLLDETVIDLAKKNLQSKHQSLSGLVEAYFKALITHKTDSRTSSAPITKELTGVFRKDYHGDINKIRVDYLMEKYA